MDIGQAIVWGLLIGLAFYLFFGVEFIIWLILYILFPIALIIALFYAFYSIYRRSKQNKTEIGNDELKKMHEKFSFFLVIKREIEQFNPPKSYENEEGYHGTLFTWLKAKFPNAKYEHQLGYTRPDIVIGNIAIEVKGPTLKRDLDTIPNKCLEYRNHYDEFIVVLFDVKVDEDRYQKWYENILNYNRHAFKHFEIIRK